MEAEKIEEKKSDAVEVIEQAEPKPVGLLELTPEKSTWLINLCENKVAEHTKQIQGKDYVLIEGWKILGSSVGCYAHCEKIKRVYNEKTGDLIGVEAYVSIVRNGQVLSKAVGFVGVDETKWKQESHRVGMAQTRAESRAYSNVFRVVVVSMGYEGTTAEEMQGVEDVQQVENQSSKKQPVQKNEMSENEKKVLYKELQSKQKEIVLVMNDCKERYGDDDFVKEVRQKCKQKEYSQNINWLVETIAKARSKIADFDRKKKAMPTPPRKDDPPLKAPEPIKADGKEPTTKAETKQVESFADDSKPTGTPKWLDGNANDEGDPFEFAENEGMDDAEFLEKFEGDKGMKENAKAT